ncbi:bifunctional 2-polyprenyl-6-hydroxyphenol methylase/3-demethylubiquinol 3-O-methyltransferase UbiG [Allosediminivita pacifica]|uniref:3-demethylubiquinone-9 3-methyltransferase n=1 Tax=Allosediminivita pacifica TaxID=1267769 RepID=A0A2T6AVA3_9RHOB|nr:bifunctional 2-polyprenyl-6-hydroxyphenol methylase/3-demethylubiquinol 3-O-methyltransferase UbiG [Allosediminivita pacifica]PTX47752.1 3-demethylubiquinone-9 3-methyltransferase [Allosediminivita pacifica]GGB13127.1 ubiquinone biosynthesis O-methyltransferase [Allosediminivita pacifica]
MAERNDLSIYDGAAEQWWSDEIRWVRTLKNLVPARMRWFSRHVRWTGKRVLDVGCAGGFMAEALAGAGAEVTGIDPAEKALKAARAHAARNGLSISYDRGSGENLPYDDGTYDAVVCVDVLEHVDDPLRVLAEAARVLRPGGRFFYDTINRNVVARLLAVGMAENVIGLLPKGAHDPEMFLRPAELEQGMRQVGLDPEARTGLGPRGVNRRGDLVFGRLPGSAVQYMGVARKLA